MALHPALRALIDAKLAHAQAPQWQMPIGAVREAFRHLWTPAITGETVAIANVAELSIPGPATAIPARVYTPRSRDERPPLLYFHGGGYVKGGIEESDAFCRALAQATSRTVVSIAYRLAPEHRFPAALDDAVAATRWAAANAAEFGGVQGQVDVCGESAGGNLAAVTCLRLRADRSLSILHQVLLQPVVDFTMRSPSIAMAQDQCLVPRADLDWYYRTYLGGARVPEDADVSPLFAIDLSGLPPALIIAAEFDTLRDEAQAYARRLAAAGVATRYICAEGMIHGFLQMRGLVPDAVQQALQAIDNALRT